MKKTIQCLVIGSLVSGCWGYSSKGNEATGQVKYVEHLTPVFCDDRVDVVLARPRVRQPGEARASRSVLDRAKSAARGQRRGR